VFRRENFDGSHLGENTAIIDFVPDATEILVFV